MAMYVLYRLLSIASLLIPRDTENPSFRRHNEHAASEDAMSTLGVKRNVKKGYELDQRRRVKEAMDRQKNERRERMDLARKLGAESRTSEQPEDTASADMMGDGQAEVLSPSGDKGGGRGGRGKHREAGEVDESEYRGQLMMPEWMVAAPEGLRDEWLVCARPEGKRCLVVASGGRTVSRLRELLLPFQGVGLEAKHT